MRVSNRLVDVTLASSLVTVVLELASIFVPGWLVLEVTATGDDVTHRKEIYAVWFIIICSYNVTHSNPCVTHSYVNLQGVLERRSQQNFLETDPDIGDHKPRITFSTIQQWEIEVTLGFVCAVVSTGVLIRMRMRNKDVSGTPMSSDPGPSTIVIVVAAVTAGGSCLTYILSVQRIAKIHTSLHTISSLTKTKTGVPYGLLIASLATLAAFVTTVCAMVMVGCRKLGTRTDADRNRDETQVMPMLPVQNSSGQQHSGYASPLPPQYVGYKVHQGADSEILKTSEQ